MGEGKVIGPDVMAKLKFEYYKLRIEQTLSLTQQSTRLIYLVNGGILGAMYFAHDKTISWIKTETLDGCLLILLAGINLIHVGIIVAQAYWYDLLDDGLAESSGATKKVINIFGIDRYRLFGFHQLYALMHLVLAAALAYAGIVALSCP